MPGNIAQQYQGVFMAKVTVSFTLDDRGDRDIVAWLDKIPAGAKSGAIRDVIRAHLRGGVSLGDIYQKLLELDAKLAKGALVVGAKPMDAGDVDEPADVALALDNLGL